MDRLQGRQKGLNDVEAKREPRQFTARGRVVTKQNFRVIRLNSLRVRMGLRVPIIMHRIPAIRGHSGPLEQPGSPRFPRLA